MVVVLYVLPLVSLGFVLVMHLGTRWALRARPRNEFTPGVTILKPVRGIDDGLADNLESFAKLDYPEWELLIGTEDPLDPALPVAREFKARHPGLAISIFVCEKPIGLNPKVNVLAGISPHARHGFLLVSDSNVRVEPGFLRASVAPFQDERVALVSNPVIGRGEETLGSALENAQLNSFIIGAICVASVIDKACVLGKSMMVRRDAFEKSCGWRSLRNVLAEDYFSGWRLEQRGYKVKVAPHAVTTWNQRWTPSRFLARHTRWSQLRRRIDPPTYLCELLLNPIPLTLALAATGRTNAIALAITVALAKLVSDRSLAAFLRPESAPPSIRAILLKDMLLPWIWLNGALRKTVEWRGHIIGLGRNTRLIAPREAKPLAVLARAAGRAEGRAA